jgi:membrane protease YdiL (CAAX protease family)
VENNWTSLPSRPSPTLSDKRPFPIGWSLLALVGLALVYVVPPNAYAIWYILAHHIVVDPKHPERALPADAQLIAQIIDYLPIAVYLLAVLPPLARNSLASLGFRLPTVRQVAIALAGAVAMYVATVATQAVVQSFVHAEATEAAIALLNELNSNVEKGVFIVVAVLLAPMIEELTFRIFLFNALERFVPAGGAIAISGILFGLVHSASLSQILTVALPLAAAGIVLGTIYARTRNYWACVVTHATFNATSVIALVVFHVKG